MCNCGGRRSALASQLSANAAPPATSQADRQGRRVVADEPLVSLVSRTLSSFILRGPATGRQYHFVPRSVLRVDSRDARSLLASGRVRRSG